MDAPSAKSTHPRNAGLFHQNVVELADSAEVGNAGVRSHNAYQSATHRPGFDSDSDDIAIAVHHGQGGVQKQILSLTATNSVAEKQAAQLCHWHLSAVPSLCLSQRALLEYVCRALRHFEVGDCQLGVFSKHQLDEQH